MTKTIVVNDELGKELESMKNDKSFSHAIQHLINENREKDRLLAEKNKMLEEKDKFISILAEKNSIIEKLKIDM